MTAIPSSGRITEISNGDELIDYTPGFQQTSVVLAFVFLLVLFAAFFQHRICKNPDTFLAKVLKYALYLLGALLLTYCYSILPPWRENPGYHLYIALYAFVCGSIFCSYFVRTHHLCKYKKDTRSLFVKILFVLLLFQVLLPLVIIKF